MSEQPTEPPKDDIHPLAATLFGWVDGKSTGRIIFILLGVLSGFLILADLVHHRHTDADIEKITGAYGFYGFLAFSFVVLMGWPLGRLLRRSENYYGDEDPDGRQTREELGE